MIEQSYINNWINLIRILDPLLYTYYKTIKLYLVITSCSNLMIKSDLSTWSKILILLNRGLGSQNTNRVNLSTKIILGMMSNILKGKLLTSGLILEKITLQRIINTQTLTTRLICNLTVCSMFNNNLCHSIEGQPF